MRPAHGRRCVGLMVHQRRRQVSTVLLMQQQRRRTRGGRLASCLLWRIRTGRIRTLLLLLVCALRFSLRRLRLRLRVLRVYCWRWATFARPVAIVTSRTPRLAALATGLGLLLMPACPGSAAMLLLRVVLLLHLHLLLLLHERVLPVCPMRVRV